MCGIAGIFFEKNLEPLNIIEEMLDKLNHRGPDGKGTYSIPEMGGVAGHVRLSIIDLSTNANQPMVSPCHRYVLIFNGEIYNFTALRQELEQRNISFATHSDTEVLLQSIITFGIDKTLEKVDGMFAFAFVDRQEKTLILARDPFGEKPLYYSVIGGTLIFSSDLSGFFAYPPFRDTVSIDPRAVTSLLQYSYIPDSGCIYKNVNKVAPGTYLLFKNETPQTFRYFNCLAQSSREIPYEYEKFVQEVHQELKESVKRRCIADVPLGCLLSGGIDSSLVASLMQEQASLPINTFTIGYNEADFNESQYAKSIARRLGTNHHELILKPNDIISFIERIPQVYSEPFADSSQLPTMVVSEFARKKVKVVLTGDGGDEIFGGYNRYIFTQQYQHLLNHTPAPFLNLLAKGLVAYKNMRKYWYGEKTVIYNQRLDKLNNSFRLFKDREAFFHNLVTIFPFNPNLMEDPSNYNVLDFYPKDILNRLDSMMVCDLQTYLPGDILTKVDRATMAFSLESRTPYLNKDLFRMMSKAPNHFKVKNGKGKIILRDILKTYIPVSEYDRPKTGFGIPISNWIKSELREMFCDYLSLSSIKNVGFINPLKVEELLNNHLKGKEDNSYLLWNIFVFVFWNREQKKNEAHYRCR